MNSESQKRIELGLRDLSREMPEHSHMELMLSGAKRRMERKTRLKNTAKRWVWVGTAVTVTMIVLLVVPVSYDMHVGSLVTAEWSAPGVDPSVVAAGLSRIEGVSNCSTDTAGETSVSRMAFKGVGASQARGKVQETLKTYLGAGAQVNISSRDIVKRIGGNVLAAGTGGRIIINAQGLSDAELERAIVTALYEQGATYADVRVATDEDGYKKIDVEMEGLPGTSDGEDGADSLEITN